MSQALKQKFEQLYETVKDLKSLPEIKAAVEPVKDWIDNQKWKDNTRGKNLSKAGLNKIFNQIPLEDGKNAVLKPKHDENGKVKGYQLRHYAIELLQLTPEEWSEVNKGEKVIARLEDKGTAINPSSYLNNGIELINSADPRIVAIGLVAVTGRRPTEIVWRGEFEKTGEYQLLFAKGLLKQKGKTTPPFEFPVLIPADTVLEKLKSIRKYEGFKQAIKEIEQEYPNNEIKQNEVLSNRLGRDIRRKVSGLFAKNLELRLTDDDHNQKALRAAYACLAVKRDFVGSTGHKMLQYARILGHLVEEEKLEKRDLMNLVTSLGYSDYYVSEGLKVPYPQINKKKKTTEKRVSVRISQDSNNYIDLIAGQQKINKIEALEFVISQSQKAESLASELEAEKLKTSELENKVTYLQEAINNWENQNMNANDVKALVKSTLIELLPEMLPEVIPTQPSANHQENGVKDNIKLETKTEIEVANKPQETQTLKVEYNFEHLSNQELWANPRKGNSQERSARSDEKIRRCFLAMCAYNNEIATGDNDRLAITNQALRELSGCNGQIVGQWLSHHSDEVINHNSKFGLCKAGQLTSYANKKLGAEKITELLKLIDQRLLEGVAFS